MNCLKHCSLEIVNEKHDTGKDLLGCLPTRITIRIREFNKSTKRKKSKNKTRGNKTMADDAGSLHKTSTNSEKIPTK